MKNEKGFVGIIFLLISIALIAFLVWNYGFAPGVGKTQREVPQEDLEILEQARDLKGALEQRYR